MTKIRIIAKKINLCFAQSPRFPQNFDGQHKILCAHLEELFNLGEYYCVLEYVKIAPHQYDCSTCPSPCDSKSKGKYIFEDDLSLSEYYEERIAQYVNSKGVYVANKSQKAGFPDVEVREKSGEVKAYIEVKAQQRTFMQVEKRLPYSRLLPSETLALNLSDLKRYFEQYDLHQKPIYIVWVLLQRPCILGANQYKLYTQKIEVLREIYEKQLNNRIFRRKSGIGDVVGGEHLGVVVNYHFSINELEEWNVVLG